MPNLVEQQAFWVARTYLKKRRYSVEDVSKNRQHKGYDLLARKGTKKLKIEVKGCSRPWRIPDPYVTEFSKGKVESILYDGTVAGLKLMDMSPRVLL